MPIIGNDETDDCLAKRIAITALAGAVQFPASIRLWAPLHRQSNIARASVIKNEPTKISKWKYMWWFMKASMHRIDDVALLDFEWHRQR